MTPPSESPGPPPPPPPEAPRRGGLAQATRSRLPTVAGFALQVGIGTALIWAFLFWDRSGGKGDVYERYNDALIADDVGAAWGLLCREVREDMPLDEFEERLTVALRTVGELESWSRLRGGAEWHGTRADERRRPEVVDGADHSCVRIGGNPLGNRF
jgi:hypothetical protein